MARWSTNINPNNPYDVAWDEYEKERENKRRQELINNGVKPLFDENGNGIHLNKDRGFYGDCDHPNTPENSTATIFWIVALVIGSIFHARWMIWIVSTIVWLRFITRHNIKK
jgi:hypothetical protein